MPSMMERTSVLGFNKRDYHALKEQYAYGEKALMICIH